MATITLRPSVPDFGWTFEFGDSAIRPALTWYSEEHKQLVVSPVDMTRIPRDYISLIEKFEAAMIDHMFECEKNKTMLVLVCAE